MSPSRVSQFLETGTQLLGGSLTRHVPARRWEVRTIAILANVQDSSGFPEPRGISQAMLQLADELNIYFDAPTHDVPENEGPAASLIDELGRVTKELMLLHPQSPELRQKCLAWQRLIFDELLDPI